MSPDPQAEKKGSGGTIVDNCTVGSREKQLEVTRRSREGASIDRVSAWDAWMLGHMNWVGRL